MERRIGSFSMLAVTPFLATVFPAAADPRPPLEIPELEEALRAATTHPGRNDCGELPALVAKNGLGILREGTLPWIRQNMRALESCLIASQRNAGHPDSILHREFRVYASPPALKAMCAVLRERLDPPKELMELRGLTDAMRLSKDARAFNHHLERVFALLERGTAAPMTPPAGSYRTVFLQVRFDDGLRGDLSADESGSVGWQDNTRLRPPSLSQHNPAAARAIIELADTAVLGFVDGDGVSLRQRRQAAKAPPH